MQLTKFTHACLLLEQDGTKIVFDPGIFSTDFTELEGLDAVIITHEHPDHLHAEKLRAILAASPSVQVYTNASVAAQLAEFSEAITVVQPDKAVRVGAFNFKFVGGQHAQIYSDVPPIQNIGVIINNLLFVPGDSYFVPEQRPAWLALPLNAPWANIQDTVNFARAMQPQYVVPVHDGLLSEAGHQIYGGNVERQLANIADYQRLQSGQKITLA